MVKKKKTTSSKKTGAQKKSQKDIAKPSPQSKQHTSGKSEKTTKNTVRSLPSSWALLKQSVRVLGRNKKILGGVLLVYGILQIILVQGILVNDFPDIKNAVDESIGGLAGAGAILTYMIGSAGQVNTAEASVYQLMLFIICSLAFIWALRQVIAQKKIRIRDAFYKGMYPLIPFVLVLLVIGLQTIPVLLGTWLYSVVVSNGIASSAIAQAFWLFIFLMSALLSMYMICSSLFALYVATLPDMAPMRALKSARELVRYRRWSVIRKIIILVIALVVVVAIIMVPIIVLVAAIAPIAFYILSIFIMGFSHTYMYTIYRELLLDE
jgi:hypothetical protein